MIANRSIELLKLLAGRLERLSADSHWARRASGLRGNILKVIEEADSGEKIPTKRLNLLIDASFNLLRLAGEEIPDIERLPRKSIPPTMKKGI